MSTRAIPHDVAVVVVAGGSGTRMGGDVNKPYLPLMGKTVLEWTISRFAHVEAVAEVILVYRNQDRHHLAAIRKPLQILGVRRFVSGGARRQDSVAKGVRATSTSVNFVAIHDAVRPLVDPKAIRKVIQRARKAGCALLARPVRDTVKRQEGRGWVGETVERNRLWLAQTPQVVCRKTYLQALRHAAKYSWEVTDDAGLMERFGQNVALVEDAPHNLKITDPHDLAMAEFFLRRLL